MPNLSSVHILDVWRALGGPEPKRGRAPAWWRDGDNPQAVSLNEEKGCWHDFREHSGGGVLALVKTVLNCDQATALRWLEGQGLIKGRTFTPEDRREYALRTEVAEAAAHAIENWRDALTLELNGRKLTAASRGDYAALAFVAPICNTLENGSAEEVVREFIRQQAGNPSEVARLVAAGQESALEGQRITADVVLLLARAAAEDSRDAA